ncbi:MAG TPA: hypothetical protein VEH29_00590 [Acidimicrobiales bacterium]|nr:hypothetical protein [Acidimicrobiales bacterium]
MHPIERLRWIARAEDEPAASLASEAAWTLGELAQQEPTALLTACRRLLDRHPACGPLWWVSARLAAADDPLEAGRQSAAELCTDHTSDRIARALRSSFTASDVVVLTDPVELSLPAFESSQPYALRVIGSSSAWRRSMRALSAAAGSELSGWSPGEEHEALEGAAVLLVEALAAAAAAEAAGASAGGRVAGRGGVLVSTGTAVTVKTARNMGIPAWAVIGVGRALPERLFDAAAERAGERADLLGLDDFSLAIGPDLTAGAAEVAAQVTCPPGPELLHRSI